MGTEKSKCGAGWGQSVYMCVRVYTSLFVYLPPPHPPPLQRKFFRMRSSSFSNAFCSLWWVPEYLAFSDSAPWKFEHPKILYAWDGACVWIPCHYRILNKHLLDNLTVYHNYKYDSSTKSYNGTILYKNLNIREFPPRQGRVQFLGNDRYDCTLLINPVKVNDSGQLGLRMTSGENKWMEAIGLNISGKALRMGSFVSAMRKVGSTRLPGQLTNQVACRGQTGMPVSDRGATGQWRPWQTGA